MPWHSAVIVSQPTNQTVQLGNLATLAVDAIGEGLVYDWTFNGTNIPGATGAVLTYPEVELAQAGTYSILISNTCGAVVSSDAVLNVTLGPAILEQPTNFVFFPNQPVALSVVAAGTQPLQYQWQFDGTNIAGATQSVLAFNDTQPSQAGTYTVVVGTEPNVTVSSNAVLTVHPPHQVVYATTYDLETVIQAGGTVTFAMDCTIDLTNTITILNDVVLNGTGHSVTISGGGAVELFSMPAGVSFTLRNLVLANGLVSGLGGRSGRKAIS